MATLNPFGLYKSTGWIRRPESVITMRPRFITFKKQENIFGYNNDSLLLAWKLLLKASPSLHQNDGYQYDLVNTGRQVLANEAVLLEQKVAEAYKDKDINAFERLSRQYLSLIEDINTLLGTRKDFLLGKWIETARSWGKTPAERNLYEFNARDLITLWGNKTSTLHDYARKQWNGLLTGFYKQLWQQFFVYALKCLKENKRLDTHYFNNQVENWEWNRVNGHQACQEHPAGDPVSVSALMYNKYAEK